MNRKPASECGGCSSTAALILLNVRHRGAYFRWCASCVLKNHSGLFCPICFEVYQGSPPPVHERGICVNCPSISHSACAVRDAEGHYQCPPCRNPSFLFFDLAKSSGEKSEFKESMRIDGLLAKQLVAACKIALDSMNKAVTAARNETEKKVKEAAVARKRVRESLERIDVLVAKEKLSSKKLTVEHKITPKMSNPFLAGTPVQNQIKEERPCNGEGEKKVNGFHPVPRF